MQDQPVMRMAPLLRRHEFGHVGFDRARRGAERQSKPVRNAEHVRINREGRRFEHDRHHDVGGLPADARQRFQLGPFARNFTTVLLDQSARGGDDVLGLRAEEPARLDDPLDVALPRRGQRRRIGIAREQERRR